MQNKDEQITFYLIKNTSNEKKMLVDFLAELYKVDPVMKEYAFFRLWTDTYSIWPREYEPNKTYEVRFAVNVCVLGRVMNKITNSGKLPSFNYVRIKDDEGFLLPGGERIADPYKTAIESATLFIND